MKVFAIVLLSMVASVGWTAETDASFQQFLGRHKQMVSNGGDVSLRAEVVRHQGAAEIAEVVSEVSKGYKGLDGLVMHQVHEEQGPKDAIIKALIQPGYPPFYCGTMTDQYDDVELCRSNTRKLLGNVLSGASSVYLLQAYGNYYGDWEEMVVVVQNYKTSESLVISFDIIHEI